METAIVSQHRQIKVEKSTRPATPKMVFDVTVITPNGSLEACVAGTDLHSAISVAEAFGEVVGIRKYKLFLD